MAFTNDPYVRAHTPRATGDKPVILVTGATGAQGGSVARHLLQRGLFAVRALTRDPRSPQADELRALGAEVVRGNLDNVDGLRAAMGGCYGVYGVTNFWEHFDREYEHGINLVDAVADAGVGHFVFSTLPSCEAITDGKLPVRKFDLKAKMEEYARQQNLPATFVHLAFYFDNFISFTRPQKQTDGTYLFGFPQGDTPLAGIGAEDIGGAVATIFENREQYLGETVYLVGDDIAADEYAAIITRLTGRTVRYNYIPRDTFAAFGFPGAEEIANMFEFYRTFVPNRRADLSRTRELYAPVQDFETWLGKNTGKLVAALDA